MHARLKHLIISFEKFKEKKKAKHDAQARGKEVSRGKGIGKHSKEIRFMRVDGKGKGKRLSGKGDKPKIKSGSKQGSGSTIGIHDKLICLFDFRACVDFCVLFLLCYEDQLVISSLRIGMEVIK